MVPRAPRGGGGGNRQKDGRINPRRGPHLLIIMMIRPEERKKGGLNQLRAVEGSHQVFFASSPVGG